MGCRLLKAFLRELPTSVMNDMYGAYIQAQKLPSQTQRTRAMLLITHLLPIVNVCDGIRTGRPSRAQTHLLRYVLLFCQRTTLFKASNQMARLKIDVMDYD